MTKELSDMHRTVEKAKNEFAKTANRVTKKLESDRKRLVRDIKKASTRAVKARDQLAKKAERLAKTTSAKVEKELRAQIKNLKETRTAALAEAKHMRGELVMVRNDLGSAKDHMARALHLDKAMTAIEKKFSQLTGKKAKKKTKRKAKKKTSKKVVKKATAGRKKVARKKAVTRKKATAKKTTRKAA